MNDLGEEKCQALCVILGIQRHELTDDDALMCKLVLDNREDQARHAIVKARNDKIDAWILQHGRPTPDTGLSMLFDDGGNYLETATEPELRRKHDFSSGVHLIYPAWPEKIRFTPRSDAEHKAMRNLTAAWLAEHGHPDEDQAAVFGWDPVRFVASSPEAELETRFDLRLYYTVSGRRLQIH
jgi:hypothetical protein